MANRLACYYYSPVYLVGSALARKDYNDVDVVVVMTDENFQRRYGSLTDYFRENNENIPTNVRQKWAVDCYKRWEMICDFTGLNIDFKTQSKSISMRHKDKPYLRLDNLSVFN